MSIKNLKQAKRLLETIAPKGESLAFINSSEAKALKKMGGSGHLTEAGIPSYFGGIGSKFKSRIRKIIPNEISDAAVKLAPFIAPFNPALAAAMSGIGSFDKSGRIGSSLKSGLKTYALGQGARIIGGAGVQGNPFASAGGPNTFMGNFGEAGSFRPSSTTGFSSPMGDTMFNITPEGNYLTQAGADEAAVQQYLKEKQAAEIVSPNLSSVSANTKPVSLTVDNPTMAYNQGTDPLLTNKSSNVASQFGSSAPDLSLAKQAAEAGPAKLTFEMFKADPVGVAKAFFDGLSADKKLELGIGSIAAALQYLENEQIKKDTVDFIPFDQIQPTQYNINYDRDMYKANGGRIKMNRGGLGSIPQTFNIPQGMQLDGRGGGFIPMGAREMKDDVPAMLAKNEFVMTADAVQAAGGGSIEKGAQKMYDVMNQLEAQV